MEKKLKIKILLVDDDEMMRIFFQDIFWIHGRNDKYEIEKASSLEEAEKIIIDEKTKPDIVFLDLILFNPGEKCNSGEKIENTLSFIKKIKTDKKLSSIKIIIYSSYKEKAVQDEAIKLGIDGYLVKGELMPKEIIDFTDKIHESNN